MSIASLRSVVLQMKTSFLTIFPENTPRRPKMTEIGKHENGSSSFVSASWAWERVLEAREGLFSAPARFEIFWSSGKFFGWGSKVGSWAYVENGRKFPILGIFKSLRIFFWALSKFFNIRLELPKGIKKTYQWEIWG